MKKSKYSDSQILGILKQAESGVPVPEQCREHGISSSTFYKWRSKYGAMYASMMARLKAEIRKEAPLRESSKAISAARDGQASDRTAWIERPTGLWGVVHHRDLLPLHAQALGRERRNRRMVDSPDAQPAELGLRLCFLYLRNVKGFY